MMRKSRDLAESEPAGASDGSSRVGIGPGDQGRPGPRGSRCLATLGGVGRLPVAPGSWGALVAVPFGVVFGALPWPWRVAGCVLLTALATWAVSRYLGSSTHQDPQEVVLDEFVGCLITLCWIPVEWVWLAAGYGLFRLFDIWKPGPIGYVDKRWHGGPGIMADDVLAGLIAGVLLAIAHALTG